MSMNLDKLEKQIKQGKIDLKDLSDWLERRLTLDELDVLRDDGFVTDKDLFFIYASSSKKVQERWLNGLHLIALNDAKRKLSNGFKFKCFKGFSMEGYFKPVPGNERENLLKDDEDWVFLANNNTVFQCSSHDDLEEVLDNNLFEKGEDDDKADITLFM